ncbi:MAG: nucleic acid binding OB-fold tRNA/helicase-type [Actinomycetia bacterium]|nr:nucleic acid binding OB-fold tRNA/helicase-type [Actinomycetes bacterium]
MTTTIRRTGARLPEPPTPLPAEPRVPLPPDGTGYRVKRKLLGPALNTEDLEHERLGRPTALAVFASDNLSSSAYATEEILRVLVPVIGVAAFALVVPITIAMLVVLAFLILSYRETIKAYPTAGGAYMVTRDNFGIMPAQIAGVSLLTDYILTVAVSVAAGTAALVSAAPALKPFTVEISVFFIVLIAYGNLRGVKESGRVFAVPTYFFIVNMIGLIGFGVYRMVAGGLPHADVHQHGIMHFGSAGDGLLLGAGLYVVLHAFASGGAAVTGVEAISNGVPAFRKPEWKNARSTLVVMGTLLGAMFLGLSVLAAKVHAAPFTEGTPTVIAQVGKLVYGDDVAGHVLFYALQAGTMLILVLAANTSFADFPRLASFHAGDNFMPRQLTKRGHRLVFSNGIIFLAAAAVVLVIATQAKVDRLIPLYAIGVFTSFTLSQAGMAKHHLTHREPKWRSGLFVNGVGAVLSLLVDLIIAVTKFEHGAWVIVLLVPIMVFVLARLNRRYVMEAEALETDVPAAATAPVLRRHVVLVFVDQLDLAAARAIQYARTLHPSELRAVHFAVDVHHAEELAASWRQLGLSGIPLEIVECPDRRLNKAAVETVALDLADGGTEVSVLLPSRQYKGVWGRLLHDRTADAIGRDVSKLAHANVTTVPFHFESRRPVEVPVATPAPAPRGNGHHPRRTGDGVAIAEVRCRERVTVQGRVRAVRVRPLADVPSLEVVLTDGSGSLSVVFHGRREIPGITVGTVLQVTGTAIDHHGRLAILNPTYTLVARGGHGAGT